MQNITEFTEENNELTHGSKVVIQYYLSSIFTEYSNSGDF